jgi:hypothetical protein
VTVHEHFIGFLTFYTSRSGLFYPRRKYPRNLMHRRFGDENKIIYLLGIELRASIP